MSQLIEQITGNRVYDKKGGKFFFHIYLTGRMSETPIEALDLGVRAYNSLRRAGFGTIGELAEAIASGVEISRIRNCGAKSRREIMEKLFFYQYNALAPEKRQAYINEMVNLNRMRQGDLSQH